MQSKEKRRLLGLWRERCWNSGRRRVAKLSLSWPTYVLVWGRVSLCPPLVASALRDWWPESWWPEVSGPATGLAPLHQGPGLRAFQTPDLGALLWLPKDTLQLGKHKSKGKKNPKNWITAIESLRECLMGPLINDSGSQGDIAFGLMPCNTPEAHCNEPIKRAPSSRSALAQNTPEFNVWWMAKWCL